MSTMFFVLGRQPEFGIAELEGIFPDQKINIINEKIISINRTVDKDLMDRLGGTVKIAEELITLKKSQNISLESIVNKFIPETVILLPEGKINFGISYYGKNYSPKDVERLSITIKKLVKKAGRSIRVVPNKELELSSAQVFHNKLTKKTGFELIIMEDSSSIIFAKTIAVQNIDSYSSRDQQRPYRDAKIGMLPPKLAQIMLNIINPLTSSLVLDPFCGTGVILQEALLMHLEVIGTDLDKRMVEYSTKNIEWLKLRYPGLKNALIESGDATTHKWNQVIDCIVTECYLGKPFFQSPNINTIGVETQFVNDLILKFLKNIHPQIIAGTKLCLAIPAWRYGNDFLHLPILDHLDEIGYNPMSFKNLDTNKLIYFRENQTVARQMLLLVRK
jgi:tRNA G10  N-methylase Trm11